MSQLTLTKRELQVARHGTLTNAQIASELGISEHTVKNHWHHIYTKLGAAGLIPSKWSEKRILALKALKKLGVLEFEQLPIDSRKDEVW